MRLDAVIITLLTLYCLYTIGATEWWEKRSQKLTHKDYNATVFFATILIALGWMVVYKMLTTICSSIF